MRRAGLAFTSVVAAALAALTGEAADLPAGAFLFTSTPEYAPSGWRHGGRRFPKGSTVFLARGEEARIRVRTTLTALRNIGRHLGALPGRKSLIWMTAGISMRAILGTLPELWHGALDVLNDANVAVCAVDSAGVRTLTGFLAERPTRALALRPSAGSSTQMTHVMLGIAEGTGGRAFLNTNDLAASVSRALNDSQTFYRLAYRPRHGRWDGRHFSIQVKIPNRRGLEIRHRLGYFARGQSSIPEDGVIELLPNDLAAVWPPEVAYRVGVTQDIPSEVAPSLRARPKDSKRYI